MAEGTSQGGILEFLGWIVHADRSNLANSNVADVAQSVINVLEKIVFIVMILMSPMMTKAFGKKAIAVVGFALTTIAAGMFYFIAPDQIGWMVALTMIVAVTYGPTIPVLWAMFADVADFGEWTTGRRTTGIIFATIGFALKAGLSLGAFRAVDAVVELRLHGESRARARRVAGHPPGFFDLSRADVCRLHGAAHDLSRSTSG